jgi:SAM-dependent methyltransferase
MIKVYRDKPNAQYWDDRWAASGVDTPRFDRKDIYPIRYSELVMGSCDKVLEAGCGAGRLMLHYMAEGKDMEGIENSQVAVDSLKRSYPDMKVRQGDICALPYADGAFDGLLAFGLYHNLEDQAQIEAAFRESARVLRAGGKIVLSVRHDSLENRIIERIVSRRNPGGARHFHRMHFTPGEVRAFLGRNGVKVTRMLYARNVSFLFKFGIFRSAEMKAGRFDESKARSLGFRLNAFGRALDALLHGLFPRHFSNLMVAVGEKVD